MYVPEKREMSAKERLDKILRLVGKESLPHPDITSLVVDCNVEQIPRGDVLIIGFNYDGKKCYIAYHANGNNYDKIKDQETVLRMHLGSAYY